MKHNKLLEVAHNKTQRQCDAIKTFLKANKLSVTNQQSLQAISNGGYGA